MGEDERRKGGRRGKWMKEVRAGANCAKGRWRMPSKVGRAEGGWGKGGAVERQRWCKRKVKRGGLLTQTEKSLHRNS